MRGPTVIALMLCLPLAVAASEQSEILSARGSRAFDIGEYGEALELFEQAVQADPDDVDALFRRGLARAHREDYDGAVDDFRNVLRRRPSLSRANLELGIALFDSGREGDAIPWLEKASRNPAMRADASFFLGLCHLRLGDSRLARAHFQVARADPQRRTAATYYTGLIDFRAGDTASAKRSFEAVAKSSPGTEIAAQAEQFLAAIAGRRVPSYLLYGGAAIEYDSNVVLAPDSRELKDQLAFGDQADGRVSLAAGGLYSPYQDEIVQVLLGYEFQQTLYFDLHQYNLQTHQPSALVRLDLGDFELGAAGRYNYYLLETDSFLQSGEGRPWITFKGGENTATTVYYRFQREDYLLSSFRRLDANNQAVGVQQTFFLGNKTNYFRVGYQYDDEDKLHSDGNEFAYHGHQVEVRWTFRFDPWALRPEIAYRYRHETYDERVPTRRDDEHAVDLILRRDINEYLTLRVAYFGTFNNSNDPIFEYERNVGSIGVEVKF